jgi:aminopeptidase N
VLHIPTRRLTQGRGRGVVVEYRGRPRDGLIIRRNARGAMSAFGDNWPNRARYWLPTVDHPSDKARVLWSIRVPPGWRGTANMPECRPLPPACNESAPIPTYTMVLGASARMSVTRHFAARQQRDSLTNRDRIPVQVWAYPEDSAYANSGPFRRATAIVETGARLFGPFPYSRLLHVQSSTRYGGMENASVIFYAESAYVRRRMREGLVRHETAHQWFGDAVTPAEWHHVWLSEGFATYFDLVIGAALDGDSVLRRGLAANAATYLRSDDTARPVIDSTIADPNDQLNTNAYQKGGWVLHMLRGVVGDSAFFRGVREYYRRYRDLSVVTGQFQTEIERASGRRLDWFFGQWLRQPGFPRLDASWSADSTGGQVTLQVAQVQPAAWGFYALPGLVVELRRNGQPLGRRVVDLVAQGEAQTFTLESGELPDQLVLDPDGDLLLVSAVRGPPGP